MRNKTKSIKVDTTHEHIYRRLSELGNGVRQLIKILEEEESLSDCSKKRIKDLEREIY